ncbi:MAG: hypothetical protein AMJ65_18740 [Phycisphaerae bacterium SG8_4]|nr:MAG: hypothetical protein AMJ65_18740 [Phycisphaerae bacterium SG8_4]
MRYTFMLVLIAGSASLSDIENRVGRHFWKFLGGELLFLLLTGTLVIRDGKIVLTRRGRYYWVVLMGTMFSVVGDYRNMYSSPNDSTVLFSECVPSSRPRQIHRIGVS